MDMTHMIERVYGATESNEKEYQLEESTTISYVRLLPEPVSST